jgi:hypothetical protein
LKSFDILGENGLLVSNYDLRHYQAIPEGGIELSFTPLVNYAIVNAIEVFPQTDKTAGLDFIGGEKSIYLGGSTSLSTLLFSLGGLSPS